MNHVDKYFWVINHPKMGVPTAQAEIEFTPQMVNPKTNAIDEDVTLNTKFEWWIEVSKLVHIEDEHKSHFWELDCGGNTAEEAVHNLYKLVKQQYGEY